MVSLVLIDDNRLLRDAVSAMLQVQAGVDVLAATADVDDALKTVRTARPDVAVLNFSVVYQDSLKVTETIRQQTPATRVIIAGLLPAQEDIACYVRAGASGFIMKDASFGEFIATVRAVAAGAEVLPGALTSSLFSQIIRYVAHEKRTRVVDGEPLTAREQQLVALLGEGLTNKEIAAQLGISISTVKTHVHNVLDKLALRNRSEVVAFTDPTSTSVRRAPATI